MLLIIIFFLMGCLLNTTITTGIPDNILCCGICGFSGKGKETSFLSLLLANQVRGDHATGMYTNKGGLYKKALKAMDFIQQSPWIPGSTVGLGHTRFGTMGANTDQNAHPFKKGNLIGVHNGVLWGHTTLARELGVYASYQVDSELIFESIKQKGWKSLSEIEGMIAIAYTDSGNNLHLYRRDNPIFIGYIEDVLYFSSIKDSLEHIGCENIESLETNKLFIYKNGKLNKTLEVPYESTWKGARHNWDDFKKKETPSHRVYDGVHQKWISVEEYRNTYKAEPKVSIPDHTWWGEDDLDEPQGTCTLPAKTFIGVNEIEEDEMNGEDLLYMTQCFLEGILENKKINFSTNDLQDVNYLLDQIEIYFDNLDK